MNINEIIEKAKEKEKHDCNGNNSKCYLIDDYALLYGSIPLHNIDRKMELINHYVNKGFNIARILEYKIDNTKPISDFGNEKYQKGWILQERAKGHVLQQFPKLLEIDCEESIDEIYNKYYLQTKNYAERIHEYANALQEHINKFVDSYKKLYESELMIDPSKPTNFMYDKDFGFTFIDINLQEPTKLNEEHLMNYIMFNIFCRPGMILVKEKNVNGSASEIMYDLPIEIQNELAVDINILIEKVIMAAKKSNISNEAIISSVERLNYNINLENLTKKGITKQYFFEKALYSLEIVKEKNKNEIQKNNNTIILKF